ncbi:MAG: 2-oxo acid dehydrogenase subunit E2 [Verrucomicrobiales bacterium]|nr:2-oxo acid dehydrogenase subunit E2 [Verrucomicrobiales bacterium]
MIALTVPTLNSNDTDARLQVWTKESGEPVSKGEVVGVLETTKASFDLLAESDGILEHCVKEGEICLFGSVVGNVFATEEEFEGRNRRSGEVSEPKAQRKPKAADRDITITRAARELIQRYQIDDGLLSSLEKPIIRSNDIEMLVAGLDMKLSVDSMEEVEGRAKISGLSRRQEGIASLVTRSHREIPSAFHVKEVCVDSALNELREMGRKSQIMLGLPELIVWSVGQLHSNFGSCFGTVESADDQLRYQMTESANVGVTIDLGKGLFIPVVRDASNLDVVSIARKLGSFRTKAMRDNFEEGDFSSGGISISLNMSPDTLLVRPLIQWPQVSMLSVSAVLQKVKFEETGNIIPIRTIHLALAYDHRVVNGFVADAFLTAIKRQIESPNTSQWCKTNKS